MITASITAYGIAAALDQINRELFDQAETRLREKMKPARLAASPALLEELRGSDQSQIANRKSAIS
jgi:hypothetical protein